MTTRPRGVTDDADVFTSSRRRMGTVDGTRSASGWWKAVGRGTISGHERRRLREADPRPGQSREARPCDQDAGPGGQVDHGRLRFLRRRDGPAAGRQGRRRRGDPGLHGAQRRGRADCATALAMGAHKGILVSDPVAPRDRRARHGQGARRRHRADRVRPGPVRHRVHRRLHRDDAGAAGRAARPPVGHLRQARRGRRTARCKVERQTEAGYDEVECPLPGGA